MYASTVRLPSAAPVVSREVKRNMRGAAPWQLPLHRQNARDVARYTDDELADMYAKRHDEDPVEVLPTHAAFAVADATDIAFCDACGEEVPPGCATDICPHCGW